MKQAFVSSAIQDGGKAGGAGINSFGQGLLERGERVFKCVTRRCHLSRSRTYGVL